MSGVVPLRETTLNLIELRQSVEGSVALTWRAARHALAVFPASLNV
jgi:hypothetical protein